MQIVLKEWVLFQQEEKRNKCYLLKKGSQSGIYERFITTIVFVRIKLLGFEIPESFCRKKFSRFKI